MTIGVSKNMGILYFTLLLIFPKIHFIFGKNNLNVMKVSLLEVTSNSVHAKFKPLSFQEGYEANIVLENYEDMTATVSFEFDVQNLGEDGCYHINSGNVLKPGNRYEVQVYEKATRLCGNVIFFTKCNPWEMQCTIKANMHGIWDTCLSNSAICNDQQDCLDGRDESRDINGKCLVTLPRKPVKKPSLIMMDQIETPCTRATELALKNNNSAPACDPDGLYLPLQCEPGEKLSYTCHCVSSYHGATILTVENFDYFEHSHFAEDCLKIRKTIKPLEEVERK